MLLVGFSLNSFFNGDIRLLMALIAISMQTLVSFSTKALVSQWLRLTTTLVASWLWLGVQRKHWFSNGFGLLFPMKKLNSEWIYNGFDGYFNENVAFLMVLIGPSLKTLVCSWIWSNFQRKRWFPFGVYLLLKENFFLMALVAFSTKTLVS